MYANVIARDGGVPETEEDMKRMIGKFNKYIEEKGLEVNVDKTKIMRCRKKRRKWRKINWKWKDKTIGEVRSFRYLGHFLTANGRQEAHVEERVRKRVSVLRQVWKII